MRDGSLHLGDMLFHRFWCFDIENDCKFGFVKIEKTMKKNRKNTEFSETIYLRQRVRKLPVGKCYLSKGWEKSGEAVAIVTRCHPKGTFTVGIFLIDTFCIGIRDSFYRFNIGSSELDRQIKKISSDVIIEESDYVTVHNLIYGAIEFAEEAGILPDKSYAMTQYILSPDTEDIPLMQFDFGKDGRHFLIANSVAELNLYLPKLKKNLGNEFDYICNDIDNLLDNFPVNHQSYPLEDYTYMPSHGYPSSISPMHPELLSLLSDERYEFGFPDDILDRILDIPHTELRQDIEQMALFRTGTALAEMSAGEDICSSFLTHCMFLLGEIGSKESLPVVLEVLRQDEEFMDYNFGDAANEIFVPTLYILGKDRLDVLDAYLHEPGLYTYARCLLFPAVAMIIEYQPERRLEVIEWFRKLLVFYRENLPGRNCCDGVLVALLVSTLIEINATELIPEIKAVYDTGLVDIMACGDCADVIYEIKKPQLNPEYKDYLLDLKERYKYYSRWKRD